MKNIIQLYAIATLSVLCLPAHGQLMKAKELFNKADSLRGMLTPLRTCYDVQYYHLDVKVDIQNRYISGSNLFQFRAVESFNRLQFDLFENLSVDSVKFHGKTLAFERSYNAVFVDFPSTIEKGKTDSFTVYYSGHPVAATRAPWDGGFDWKTDSNGRPWVATACQGLGASVWWPNKDHQSDEVDSMLVSVSVPNGLMNVSNGRLQNVEKLENGYTRYDWKVRNPINNYNIALNIGDYTHVNETYQGEKGPLSLDYYVLKENKGKISHLQKNAKQTLDALEHWFGPYPFYEDGYKLIETAHLGMEHQSAVAYGNKFQNGYLGRDASGTGWGLKWDFIVVHESGHEWFGNNITANDLADMWIHESFTNYSEALFIDYHYGKDASLAYVHGNRQGILNDKPMQGPYHVNKEGSGDMYPKGGVLMNMIRRIIDNDEVWRRILRGLNENFYHKTVDYGDIVQYVNKESGLDLSSVFEQYVQRKSIPVLEVRKTNDGQLQCRWISETPDFKMPIHLGIAGETLKRYEVTSKFETLPIKTEDLKALHIDTFNYYIGVLMQ
ncbi:M1 family metallopeptidase [Sphingobacterium deserti]|uniref:Peptidase M1 membrane alanine aminopeptidase n=1 Tax=Sphingobacterium deserti TaxID=1229276 RepID=A0A0B8SZL6_9SPHI|nr:M1 family metallopeptidase [Sphingobacterium deserti]KGE13312.1 peptidase M1 membrane alanine aminopeptidase [Sphingobacterium deserti]